LLNNLEINVIVEVIDDEMLPDSFKSFENGKDVARPARR
jgi:hypothetical protein